MMSLNEINNKLEIPEQDKSSPIKTNEAEFIYNFLREKELKATLETGFAYARSASHIIAATLSNHIAIDPFQENYNSLGLKNIETLGFNNYLTFYSDYSHNVLPQLLSQEKKFEFIFIDGDHKFDGIFVDFYYADLLLTNSGYILLHDTWMRSTQLVMSFIKKSRVDYTQIDVPLRNFALYQKNRTDQRDGMHFREFYTFKSVFIHKIIVWLTTGNRNILKNAVYKLKDLLK